MSQTRLESAVETGVQFSIGFSISVTLNHLCFWAFDLNTTPEKTFWITVILAIASLIRSYIIRRWFNRRKLVV